MKYPRPTERSKKQQKIFKTHKITETNLEIKKQKLYINNKKKQL